MGMFTYYWDISRLLGKDLLHTERPSCLRELAKEVAAKAFSLRITSIRSAEIL